jgi:hypothetical protein
MTYSLEDFQKILETTNLDQLPDITIEIINGLALQVGAPEYIKTPQFKATSTSTATAGNIIRRRKKLPDNINDEDWGTIRTFQATEFQKQEGMEISVHKIRKFLNMLTEKTYSKLTVLIIEELETVYSTKTENDVQVLCDQIYIIVASNILYSDIYAKLYKDLISKFPIFNKILLTNLNMIETRVNSIEYVNSDENYDKFCENNKKNEQLRATSAFYANLMKEKVLDEKKIHSIIITLFSILNTFIQENIKKNELDEISELIYIFVTNSYAKIKEWSVDSASEIHKIIKCIASSKMKTTPGITNKCIFKHMDMLDEIA